MILTLFYMVSTSWNALKLRSIYLKLKQVSDKSSVAFYKLPRGFQLGTTASPAASDLCNNQILAKVQSVIWFNENSRGFSVYPIQKINLGPFITFPKVPNMIPFNYADTGTVQLDDNELMYLLVETGDMTNLSETLIGNEHFIEMENYGELLAWKVDERLAILLKTDVHKFSDLIFATFMQDSYSFNGNFQLVRAQSVEIEGAAQCYETIINHARKEALNRSKQLNSIDHFKKHIGNLKSLGVIANQAFEFEYKKNLTEGKTGIIQPDLISSKNIEESLQNVVKSPETPKKLKSVMNETVILSEETKLQELNRMKAESSAKKLDHFDLLNTQEPLKKSPEHGTKVKINFDPLPIQRDTKSSPIKILKSPERKPVPKKEILPMSPPQEAKIEIKNDASTSAAATSSADKKTDLKKRKTLSREDKIELLDDKIEVAILNSSAASNNGQLEKETVDTNKTTETKTKLGEKNGEPILEKKKTEEKSERESSKVKPKLTPLKTETPLNPSLSKSSQNLSIARSSQPFAKPPNILVYSDSSVTRDNVIKTLGEILEENVYTIYSLQRKEINEMVFLDNAILLVVCGSVPQDISDVLLDFFFRGGKMLCLCSDLLHNVLPTYTTAEVREHELVQFSYGKWKNIKMMHHIFCYQPSPVRKHFSTESDDAPKVANERPSVELIDLRGTKHLLQVQTLGTEETWKTPSLLLVCSSTGKIVFSQVHLEIDPISYENDGPKFEILKKNDGLRLEILKDLLDSHLGISIRKKPQLKSQHFSNAYFLGRHELKFELLAELKKRMTSENSFVVQNMTLKFCGKNDVVPAPETNVLPVLIHSCPEDFSTLDYFNILNTEQIGRLVIYAPVLTSTMHKLQGEKYSHGFTVICRQQTQGKGRSKNQWLSPEGCLMFSMQLHISLKSPLGQRLGLLQHVVATAIVSSIMKQPGYEDLDLKLKWPNDIYANGTTKIGGLIINSLIEGDTAICNIGCGVNFTNSIPTTCINDIIKSFNVRYSKNLPLLKYENTFAYIFNELDLILKKIQDESNFEYFNNIYHRYWLHSNSIVNVKMSRSEPEKPAKIIGIDEYGYLKIEFLDTKQVATVHPDGNSFDMLRNLILPKQ